MYEKNANFYVVQLDNQQNLNLSAHIKSEKMLTLKSNFVYLIKI